MKTALVGVTGFVGGNLAQSYAFSDCYHSKNIAQATGTRPDLLIYAGMPAAKYLANQDPQADLAVAQNALENVRRIAPHRLVLISTVDVYATPQSVDENMPADLQNPAAYGRNRAWLEDAVRAEFPSALIIRLPGLFGAGLKKNFLYDMLTLTPAMLTAQKYAELARENQLVAQSYAEAKNGFYALTDLAKQNPNALRTWFAENDFNALSFTDSRSRFQFYDLSRLWRDICVALAANLPLLNVATPPISAAEIYEAFTHGKTFCNETKAPVSYDMHTKYAALYGGPDGYLCSADEELSSLCSFLRIAYRSLNP